MSKLIRTFKQNNNDFCYNYQEVNKMNNNETLQLAKLVNITAINIDTENQGPDTNAWITISLNNTLDYPIAVTASVVLKHNDEVEKIELIENLEPGYNELDLVIRIEEPHFWNPKTYGEASVYTCLVGIRAQDEVQDVSEKLFAIRDIEILAERLTVNSQTIFIKASHIPANSSLDLIASLSQAGFNTLIYSGAVSSDLRNAADYAGMLLIPAGFIEDEHLMYISTDNPFEMAREITKRRLGKSDCWGVVFTDKQLSSLIDANNNPLHAYFKAKHAFVNPALGFFDEEEIVRLYVCMESPKQSVQIDLGILEASTGTIHAQPFDVFIEPHQPTAVWEADNVKQAISDPYNEIVLAILKLNDKILAKSFYTLVPENKIKLQPAKLFIERVLSEDNEMTLNIKVDNYAPQIFIGNPLNDIKATDNYIELIPGENHLVTISNISEEDSAKLTFEVSQEIFS